MQNSNFMALTEKQKASIMHLDADSLIEVLHECAEQFMTAKEYHEHTGIPMRTIYDKIKSCELKSTEVFDTKIIYV